MVESTSSGSDDSSGTLDDGLADTLREQGILGPFVITDWAAMSDVGSVRDRNEDRWAGDAERGFVVADGMGGLSGGEMAADVVANETVARLDELTEANAAQLVADLNSAVTRVGVAKGIDRLGSTLVAMVSRRHHVIVVHVGDSRAYRLRDGDLELLTRDHSVREEMLAAGVSLDSADLANVRLDALTAHIGNRRDLGGSARVASFSVMAGDRFLLCSDGVHDQVADVDMTSALGLASCRRAAGRLLDLASLAGGRDNATAIVVEFGRLRLDMPEEEASP